MVKIDLITGFLGSGKTTFIKMYAAYLLTRGERLCILENDHGAVNVDMLLMNELRSENCELEMVSGGCDPDCHKRRFKTKLISMAMSGYDRVIVEPSGIFDVDEFFDTLYEEPLDRWYEKGNVIAVVDAGLEDELSARSEYLLASQAVCAGRIVMSHVGEVSGEKIKQTKAHLKRALAGVKCFREFEDRVICKDWKEFEKSDFEEISGCGYQPADFEKRYVSEDSGYQSLYFMNLRMSEERFKKLAEQLFHDESCGRVLRVKGFMETGENKWVCMNATKKSAAVEPIDKGQEVFLVIGEDLDEAVIKKYVELFDRETEL